MKTDDVIVIENLDNIGDESLSDYLLHSYCYSGECTFTFNGRSHTFKAGDCMILNQRSGLIKNIVQSPDFQCTTIYVSQSFIEVCTPESNYGMKGHLALFNNPVIRLTPEQQYVCRLNFDYIKSRLAVPHHHFHRLAMINAIQCMIIDFFDFHAENYGGQTISNQYTKLMDSFLSLLENGDYYHNRDLGYYADKLCVTTKYLSEVSKKVSGFPANYWISRYTALAIRRLLKDRNLSFTDISEMFNFSSQYYFTRYVRKYLGTSPSDFRK